MINWKKNQLTQVAILYYEKDISQKDIGEMLKLSKMTVSRMLQRAKELKIVNTSIKLPFIINTHLAAKIKKKFKLEEVIVVKNEDDVQISVR